MVARPPLTPGAELRWKQADDPGPQGALFERHEREVGHGEFRGMEFLHVHARRLINEVKGAPTPALPFRWTINAYRGCSHACTYCFARPTHAYLGLDIGADFDQRIVVKVNAVERLRAELNPARWCGELIAMGTNTDPYQRCEGKYRLTRSMIEVLVAAGNPFSILTKSTLVLRDLDMLSGAAAAGLVRVNLSIGSLDDEVWRATEPGTPHPRHRLRAVEQLNAAGVPCGVLVAPVLPGLSDGPEQLEAVAQACVEAGAVSVSTVLLHLLAGAREHFMGSLAHTHPELVPRYEQLYRGANAPAAERRRVSHAVQSAVRRAGGTPARRLAAAHLVGQPDLPRPVPVAAPTRTPAADHQLSLGL